MSDSITVVGTVATDPRHVTTDDKLEVTTFRLASAERRYDRKHAKWVDGGTNWYTIVAFRQLASNAAQSIKKGDRVIAFGRPRVRDWTSQERSGTTMEVEADALGHDLLWGRTEYVRTAVARSETVEPPAEQSQDQSHDQSPERDAGPGEGAEREEHAASAGDRESVPAEEREPAAAF